MGKFSRGTVLLTIFHFVLGRFPYSFFVSFFPVPLRQSGSRILRLNEPPIFYVSILFPLYEESSPCREDISFSLLSKLNGCLCQPMNLNSSGLSHTNHYNSETKNIISLLRQNELITIRDLIYLIVVYANLEKVLIYLGKRQDVV